MCYSYEFCSKEQKVITNGFGNEEVQRCVLPKGHKGRCSIRPDYKVFGESLGEILKRKVQNAALSTAGETAKNSPIKNRLMRYSNTKHITKEEQYILKEHGQYRVGIRKDEASPFEYCQKIEMEMYFSLLDIFNNKYETDDSRCIICKEKLTIDNFLMTRENHNSIQSCHVDPLSEEEIMHKPGNVKWGHRWCNIVQNDKSVPDTLKGLIQILQNNGYKVTK